MTAQSASKTLSPPPDFASSSAGTFGERIAAAGGSLHAEAGLIASLVADAERVFRVVDGCRIQLHHLVDPRAQTILAACQELRAGKYGDGGVDILTLADHLRRNGESGSAMAWLESNLQSSITAHAESYADAILADYGRRIMTSAIAKAAQNIQSGNPSEVLASLQAVELPGAAGNVETVNAASWLTDEPPEVDAIMRDVFGRGDKLCVIGSSKLRKSFFILQLVTSLATGRNFLDWQVDRPLRVLLVQLEIKAAHFHRRVFRMARAMGIDPADLGDRLQIVNGRGHIITITEIGVLAKRMQADVIVFDPLFKLLTGDENKAQDVKPILAEFDRLAERTGAAVVYVHHDGKGASGDRDIRDRGAGSSVLGRDYDACITLTPHRDEQDHAVIETLLRNYPPRQPFTARWTENGCFEMSDAPAVARTSQCRPSKYEAQIVKLKKENPSLTRRMVKERVGCSLGTVQRLWGNDED